MFPKNANSIIELLSGDNVFIYLGISVLVALLLFFSSSKFLLVLQQTGYRYKKYFKWLVSPETPYLKRLMLLCLMGFLFFCVLCVCFAPLFGNTNSSYIGFASLILFTLLYIDTEKSINIKVPLRKTKRLVRLCITYIIVLIAFTYGFITLINILAYYSGSDIISILRYSLLMILPILTPYLLVISYWINEPMEELIKRSIIRYTKEKLVKCSAIKIGITGSYGKTSVKEILKTILSEKYRVLSTPSSYNTPMGIALSVKKLDNTVDIFIAEMGARYVGDIKELTEIVKPTIGVLTGINNQHLETFKSIDKIKQTKNELFEYISLSKGKGFFSTDNEGTKEIFNKFDGEKYDANGENSLCNATEIKRSENGMNFTLNIEGEKPVKCSTVLLGSHSVKNICLASLIAYKLGLKPKEIASGISKIKSVGHRLELVRNNKGIVIIDDSYNSNEDGIKSAMEVLSSFNGRKIVLTPGLVELGKAENIKNYEFGKTLSIYADKVIIIGKHNAEMLINGLVDGGMSKENISFSKNLKQGNEILNNMMQKGDVILFENDLPDTYN